METTVNGIILRVQSERMGDTSRIEILGKTMFDWVALSLGNNDVSSVSYRDGDEIPSLVRTLINREKTETVILFSDTPLITKQTVFDAVGELRASGKNVIKLTRGYVFDTEYLLRADKIYTQETHYFEVDDFVTAFSYKQVALISDILKNRILEFHMERGVHFEDMASAFVGCDVKIGKGVIIGPNNVIKGNTYIKDNARILSNNVIDTCIIEENAVINSSQLYKSYIGSGSTVGPFSVIGEGCIIGPSCRITGCVGMEKRVVEEGSVISGYMTADGEKAFTQDAENNNKEYKTLIYFRRQKIYVGTR